MTDEDAERGRTFAQAEADAQAMVDELGRLVEQLRLARAETGEAGLDLAAAGAGTTPLDQARRHPHTPRPRLASVLGLAAVALVGIVGAATITVAHDASMSTDTGSGMEPIPYARATSDQAGRGSTGSDRSTLPLGSAKRGEGVGTGADTGPDGDRTHGGHGPGSTDRNAPPSTDTTGWAAGGAGGYDGRPPQPRSAPGGAAAQGELDLIARQWQSQSRLFGQALRQAAKLQALAHGFMPTTGAPQPPQYRGPNRSH